MTNEPQVRVPPSSIEAEQAVLGACLIDNEVIDEALSLLTPEAFYSVAHREIFSALLDFTKSNRPADAITIAEHLDLLGKLEDVGGLKYLGALVRDSFGSKNTKAYAKVVLDKAKLRGVITVANRLAQEAWEASNADEAIEAAQKNLFALAQSKTDDIAALKDTTDLSRWVEELDDRWQNPTGMAGHSTGFAEIDNLAGGLVDGDLVIIGARPSSGKTVLACNIIDHYINERHPVLFFSLEMGNQKIINRLIAARARVSVGNLKRPNGMPGPDFDRVMQSVSVLQQATVVIDDSMRLSTLDMLARARRVRKRYGLRLIVVDYIQLMHEPSMRREQNRANEVAEISRGLKRIAKELNVPVVALAQLNRKFGDRADKRPVLSDLKESGSLEQDADLVVLLHRPEMHESNDRNKGIAEVIVAKNRDGETGIIEMAFRGQFMRFEPLDTESRNLYRQRKTGMPDYGKRAGNDRDDPTRGLVD